MSNVSNSTIFEISIRKKEVTRRKSNMYQESGIPTRFMNTRLANTFLLGTLSLIRFQNLKGSDNTILSR